MVNYLSVRGVVSLTELSEYLELSPRGVQRLKDTLVDTGFNIEVVRGPQGGYMLNQNRHHLNTELSIEELKLIKQGLRFLVESEMVKSSPLFTKAISKLSGSIDDYGMDAVMSYQSIRLNVDPIKYQRHIDLIDTAIQHHRKVSIEYRKNHLVLNEYTFEPYNMVIVNNFWYVNGYDEKRRYLSLKINRVENIRILESTFLKDESGNDNPISKYGYRINPIRLVTHVRNADFISEYVWGKNQNISWENDGSFLLDVEFPNENAAKDFILRHGSSIKVLEPVELKIWLHDEISKIQKMYE